LNGTLYTVSLADIFFVLLTAASGVVIVLCFILCIALV